MAAACATASATVRAATNAVTGAEKSASNTATGVETNKLPLGQTSESEPKPGPRLPVMCLQTLLQCFFSGLRCFICWCRICRFCHSFFCFVYHFFCRLGVPRVARFLFELLLFVPKWFWYSWVDIATILATTTIAGIVRMTAFLSSPFCYLGTNDQLFQLYLAQPPASRSFAVLSKNNEVVFPQFALPLRQEIVPSSLAIFLGPFVPVVCILVLQLHIRSFWDANNALFGVLYALSNATVFQVIIKWLIGGLRPHFLDVCKPDLSLAETLAKDKAPYNAAGFTSMYYTREICTGDPQLINDALSSFPSGHTTAAFAGFVFLSLYINGKFKVFSDRQSHMWKMMVFFAPILLATLIGGSLTIDAFHNWYDIVAGAVIGTTMAFSAYRMTYASIFDCRYNHIPLHRFKSFDYNAITPSHSGYTHLDNSRF